MQYSTEFQVWVWWCWTGFRNLCLVISRLVQSPPSILPTSNDTIQQSYRSYTDSDAATSEDSHKRCHLYGKTW